MTRMVNSLAGHTFYTTGGSRTADLAAAAALAAGPSAGEAAAGGRGKVSGKAELLKRANALRRLEEVAGAEAARWANNRGKVGAPGAGVPGAGGWR